MGSTEAVGHAHELFLALAQLIVPGDGEDIVGINLKDERIFAIVTKEPMTIAASVILATPVPALPVEDKDGTRFACGL